MDTGEESRLPLLNSSAQKTNVNSIFCSRNPLVIIPRQSADELISKSPDEDCCLELKPCCTKKTYSLCEKLSIDDLKKLQDFILLQIYNTSDTLVGLLQERQQLSEEAHVRLISIEQLHRLLEARCFYRGLSTGLFS